MRSPLEILPEDVTAALNAHEYFVDKPVFFYREERIEEGIFAALAGQNAKAGRVGGVVVVNMPTFGGESEVPGPQLKAAITIQSVESPILNFGDLGTGKTAEETATMVAQVLNGLFAHGYYTALHAPEQGHITPSRDFKNHVTWDVRFLTTIQLDQLNRVNMPLIDPESPNRATGEYSPGPLVVSLSCGVAHASIFYTMDESLPTPTNGTQYAGPFECPGGVNLRAAAYRQGMVGSFVNWAWYPAVLIGDESGLVVGEGGGVISGGP